MATNNAVNTSLAGQTGTGNFVGSNTPTVTTPLIVTGLRDSNNNMMIAFDPEPGTVVNWIEVTNAVTTGAVAFGANGSDSNIVFSLSGKGTAGAQIEGIKNGGNVSPGYVGQVFSATAADNAVSLTTNVAANIATLTGGSQLTAGDWDITAYAVFSGAVGTTITELIAAISLTSATLPSTVTPTLAEPTTRLVLTFTTSGRNVLAVARARVNVASTQNVYLVGRALFGASTMTAGGAIYARRAC